MIWTVQYRAHLPPRESNIAGSALNKLRPQVDLSKIFSTLASGNLIVPNFGSIPANFQFEYTVAPQIKTDEGQYLPFLKELEEEDFKIPPLENKIWAIRPISFYSSGWFIKGIHKLPGFKGMDVGWSSVPPEHEGKPWWGEYYDPAMRPYYNPPPESAFAEDFRSYTYTGNPNDPRVCAPSLIPDYCFDNLRYFFRFFDTVYILKPTDYAKKRYYRLVEDELPAIMRILQGLSWLQKVPVPEELQNVPLTRSGVFMNISLGEAYFLAYRPTEKEGGGWDGVPILPTPSFYPPALQSSTQARHLKLGTWQYSPNSGFPYIGQPTWWDVSDFQVRKVGLSLLGFINALPNRDWDSDNQWWHDVRENGIQNHVFASYSTGYYDGQGNWIMPPFVEIDTPLLIWSGTTGNYIIYNPETEEIPAKNVTRTFMWRTEEYTGKIVGLEYKLKITLNTVVRLSFLSFKKLKENAHVYAPPDPREIQKIVTPWFEVEDVFTFPFTKFLDSKQRKSQFKPRDYARHVDYLQPPEKVATEGGREILDGIAFRYATLPTGESTNVHIWSDDERLGQIIGSYSHFTDNLSVQLPETQVDGNREWLERYLKPAFNWAVREIRKYFVENRFIHSRMARGDVVCWQLRTSEGKPNPSLPITFTTEKEIVKLKDYAEKVGFLIRGDDPPKDTTIKRRILGFIPLGYFFPTPARTDLFSYLRLPLKERLKEPITYTPTGIFWVGGAVSPPELQLVPAYQVIEHPQIALAWDFFGKTYHLRKQKETKWCYLTGQGEDKPDYWASLLSLITLRPLTKSDFALFEFNYQYDMYLMKFYWQPIVLSAFNDIDLLHNLVDLHVQGSIVTIGKSGAAGRLNTISIGHTSYKHPAQKVTRALFKAIASYPPNKWTDPIAWGNFLQEFAAQMQFEGLPGGLPQEAFRHLGSPQLPFDAFVSNITFPSILTGLKFLNYKEEPRVISYLTATEQPEIEATNIPVIFNPLSTGVVAWHMEGLNISAGDVSKRWIRGVATPHTQERHISLTPALGIGYQLWWRHLVRVDLDKEWKAYMHFRGIQKNRGIAICSPLSAVPIVPPTISKIPLTSLYHFDYSYYLQFERVQQGEKTVVGSGALVRDVHSPVRLNLQASHLILEQTLGREKHLQEHIQLYPHSIRDEIKILNLSDYMLQGLPGWLIRCESIPPEGSLLSIKNNLEIKNPLQVLPEYNLDIKVENDTVLKVKSRWLVESLTVPKKVKGEQGAALLYPDGQTLIVLWHPNPSKEEYWEKVYLTGDGFLLGYFEKTSDGKVKPISDGVVNRGFFPHLSPQAPEEIWVGSGRIEVEEYGELTLHTFRADHPLHYRVYLSVFLPQRAGYNSAVLKEGYQTTFAAYWQEGDYIFTLLRAAHTEKGIASIPNRFSPTNVLEMAHLLYEIDQELRTLNLNLPALQAFQTLSNITQALGALKKVLTYLPYSQNDPDYPTIKAQEELDAETQERMNFMLYFTKAIENPVYNPFALYYAPLDFSDQQALKDWEERKPLNYEKRTACCLLILPKCPTLATHSKVDASLFQKKLDPVDIIKLVSQELRTYNAPTPATKADLPLITLYRELHAHVVKEKEREYAVKAGKDENYLASVFPEVNPFIFLPPKWILSWLKNTPDYQEVKSEMETIVNFKLLLSELTCCAFYHPFVPHYIEIAQGLEDAFFLAMRRWAKLYGQTFEFKPLPIPKKTPSLAYLLWGIDGDLSYLVNPSLPPNTIEVDVRDTGLVGWLPNGGTLQTMCVPTAFTPISHLLSQTFVYMANLTYKLQKDAVSIPPTRVAERWRTQVNPITRIEANSELRVTVHDESPVKGNQVKLEFLTNADAFALPILSFPVNILNPIIQLKRSLGQQILHRVWKQVPENPGFFISQTFLEQLGDNDAALIFLFGKYTQPYCYPEPQGIGYTKLFQWYWEQENAGTLFWKYHILSKESLKELRALLPTTLAPYSLKLAKYPALPPKWAGTPLKNLALLNLRTASREALSLLFSIEQFLFRLPEVAPPILFILHHEFGLVKAHKQPIPLPMSTMPLVSIWELFCLLHLFPLEINQTL